VQDRADWKSLRAPVLSTNRGRQEDLVGARLGDDFDSGLRGDASPHYRHVPTGPDSGYFNALSNSFASARSRVAKPSLNVS
jgi:hypothetical protein